VEIPESTRRGCSRGCWRGTCPRATRGRPGSWCWGSAC